ncbi:MAG: hypothetical protein JWM63_1682 [Gammaproteobacteria bacterium]|jgi:uncharacterized protein with GYD domain|nr:hypothetical protein [Gammaproteobacteria bacterium]
MSTYISLLRYTQKGIESIKESPGRLDAARKTFEKIGAKLKDFYLVCGQYDAVVISEAPDDATAAKASLSLATPGNVRTETFRAFTEEEFRKIVTGL